MVATANRPRRVASPERWQKALARAIENGVSAYQVANSGAWVVTSKSNPGVVYQTDGVECGCQAWLNGDPVCLHRAAYFAAVGMLDLDGDNNPEPSPTAPVAALPVPYKCATCEDSGAVRVPNRIRPDLTYRKPCPDCRPSVTLMAVRTDTTGGDQPPTLPVFPDTCQTCTGRGLIGTGEAAVTCWDCAGEGQTPSRLPIGNCSFCDGRGYFKRPGFFADCTACDGTGFVHPTIESINVAVAVTVGLPIDLPTEMPATRACRECQGTGTGLDDRGKFTDCPDCHGVGIVPRAISALDWTATLAAD